MSPRRTLALIAALALLAATGLAGMLIAGGTWDALFLLLAALPLGVGVGAWTMQKRGRPTSTLSDSEDAS